MRLITTSSGVRIPLDGDVLAVIEAVSRELARRSELNYDFGDVDREIEHLVSQLTDEELRAYLKESLFMSFKPLRERADDVDRAESRESQRRPRTSSRLHGLRFTTREP
jgi:hypothetical protein